jgi:hypothetical protein
MRTPLYWQPPPNQPSIVLTPQKQPCALRAANDLAEEFGQVIGVAGVVNVRLPNIFFITKADGDLPPPT